MRRPFPTSIYSGMAKVAAKPSYRQISLLDLVRQEREIEAFKIGQSKLYEFYANLGRQNATSDTSHES